MKKNLLFILIAIVAIAFKADKKVNIWMIGDSTMAWKKPERSPESGWGVELSHFFNGEVSVHNHAASGRSSKSFVAEKRWKAVLDSIQPGDYVIIQFGHNDEKPDSTLHTDAQTTFKQYLTKFITETRSKNAIPIICSSIVRRNFSNTGELVNTHGDYIAAAREAAMASKAIYIDMEAKTRKLVTELGPEQSKTLYNFCKPGQYRTWPKGTSDSTHLNNDGARVVAGLFAAGVQEQKLDLARFIIKQ